MVPLIGMRGLLTMKADLADKLTYGAAAIQTGLSVTWCAMGYVLLRIDRYGMLGAGVSGLGWAFVAMWIFVLSYTTIHVAVLTARGNTSARGLSVAILAAATAWAYPRIRSPWPGVRSPWVGAHPPRWFAVLSQGYPTFVGGIAVVALLVASGILRRRSSQSTSVA
jgi:hypothetical protein